MSPNDNGIGSRSPSGWHDYAAGRDAGHDDMQIAVFDYLLAKKRCPLRFSDMENEFHVEDLYFEYPFIAGGRVIAWGDIVRIWVEQDGKNNDYTKRFYEIFEIKPVVHSVGAVIRQCIALRLAAKSALADRHGNHPIVRAYPVVNFSHEIAASEAGRKVSQMRHVSQHLWNATHVYLWTGDSLS